MNCSRHGAVQNDLLATRRDATRYAVKSVSFFLSDPFSISGHKCFIIQAFQQIKRDWKIHPKEKNVEKTKCTENHVFRTTNKLSITRTQDDHHSFGRSHLLTRPNKENVVDFIGTKVRPSFVDKEPGATELTLCIGSCSWN